MLHYVAPVPIPTHMKQFNVVQQWLAIPPYGRNSQLFASHIPPVIRKPQMMMIIIIIIIIKLASQEIQRTSITTRGPREFSNTRKVFYHSRIQDKIAATWWIRHA